MVGIEVSQDDRITLGLEKELKVWGVVGRAGGGRRNIYVEYFNRDIIDGGSYCKVFNCRVVWKEMVGGKWSVGDGLVYKEEETTPA